eukprot:284818820_6
MKRKISRRRNMANWCEVRGCRHLCEVNYFVNCGTRGNGGSGGGGCLDSVERHNDKRHLPYVRKLSGEKSKLKWSSNSESSNAAQTLLSYIICTEITWVLWKKPMLFFTWFTGSDTRSAKPKTQLKFDAQKAFSEAEFSLTSRKYNLPGASQRIQLFYFNDMVCRATVIGNEFDIFHSAPKRTTDIASAKTSTGHALPPLDVLKRSTTPTRYWRLVLGIGGLKPRPLSGSSRCRGRSIVVVIIGKERMVHRSLRCRERRLRVGEGRPRESATMSCVNRRGHYAAGRQRENVERVPKERQAGAETSNQGSITGIGGDSNRQRIR